MGVGSSTMNNDQVETTPLYILFISTHGEYDVEVDKTGKPTPSIEQYKTADLNLFHFQLAPFGLCSMECKDSVENYTTMIQKYFTAKMNDKSIQYNKLSDLEKIKEDIDDCLKNVHKVNWPEGRDFPVDNHSNEDVKNNNSMLVQCAKSNLKEYFSTTKIHKEGTKFLDKEFTYTP